MQLKYNRRLALSSLLISNKTLLVLLILLSYIPIEKINFPSLKNTILMLQ